MVNPEYPPYILVVEGLAYVPKEHLGSDPCEPKYGG